MSSFGMLLASIILLVVICSFSIPADAFGQNLGNCCSSAGERARTRATPMTTTTTTTNSVAFRFQRKFALGAATDVNEMANSTLDTSLSQVGDIFPEAQILTIELSDHIPLGCTIEESLHEGDDYIFISKITSEGNAEKGGLKVGDVMVGVTGLFGDLTSTLNSDVDKIKKLVSAVPEEEPLTIQVARGTNVLERHESSIVELCNSSGASDKEVQECVVDFLAGGYNYEAETPEEPCEPDEDAECLIDDMMNLWADELPLPPTTSGITDQPSQASSGKAPKPWSSRSSPSGTWVRDPKTGKMRNIDA